MLKNCLFPVLWICGIGIGHLQAATLATSCNTLDAFGDPLVTQNSTASANCSESLTIPNGAGSVELNVSSIGTSAYGVLTALDQLSFMTTSALPIVCAVNCEYASTHTLSSFTDSLSFSNPGNFFIEVTGALSGSESGSQFATIAYGITVTNSAANTLVQCNLQSSGTCTTSLIEIGTGQSFSLNGSLSGQGGIDGTMPIAAGASTMTSVNYSALISGLLVFDASGHPVTNVTLNSESGHQYAILSSVPEPGTSGMLLMGACLAAFFRRRARAV
jgi:PEP-CTERM motif